MSKFAFAIAFFAVAAPAWGQALVVPTCGAETFAPGSLHQLTENPQGELCVYTPPAAPLAARAKERAKSPPDEPKK